MEPFQGRVTVDVFEDRFVLVPFAPLRLGSVPLVVLPSYAWKDLGRVAMATARFLPVADAQQIREQDTDLAIRTRVFGEEFLAAGHLTGAPHVTVSFYDHHGPSHMVSVIRMYKSPGDPETRGVSAEFEWGEVTSEILTAQILEFAGLTVEEMNARNA